MEDSVLWSQLLRSEAKTQCRKHR